MFFVVLFYFSQFHQPAGPVSSTCHYGGQISVNLSCFLVFFGCSFVFWPVSSTCLASLSTCHYGGQILVYFKLFFGCFLLFFCILASFINLSGHFHHSAWPVSSTCLENTFGILIIFCPFLGNYRLFFFYIFWLFHQPAWPVSSTCLEIVINLPCKFHQPARPVKF